MRLHPDVGHVQWKEQKAAKARELLAYEPDSIEHGLNDFHLNYILNNRTHLTIHVFKRNGRQTLQNITVRISPDDGLKSNGYEVRIPDEDEPDIEAIINNINSEREKRKCKTS